MTRRICIVTGSRAEYGLLRWLMEDLRNDPELTLQIVATGMHLSPEFGLTYLEIENDGFYIDQKVEMLLSSDTPVGITKSMGLALTGFADALNQLKPDLLIVLGDRFEIFCAATAAMVARIPIAHIHGGESTEAAIDEAIRHSITKMSQLHFVAAEEYRKRVIQLGEQPDKVFLVGGLGVDSIKRLNLMSRAELEKSLDFKFGSKNLMITFHPVTLEDVTATSQLIDLLASLQNIYDTNLIFTLPNADAGGRLLIKMINDFVEHHPNSRAFTSLGQLRYLSCIQYVDGVVGNSSSGLLEVPSFKKGTINIGDRQRGRLKANSVIDCLPDQKNITEAIRILYSVEFNESLPKVQNPYGDGGASKQIVEVIKKCSLSNIIQKSFFNIT